MTEVKVEHFFDRVGCEGEVNALAPCLMGGYRLWNWLFRFLRGIGQEKSNDFRACPSILRNRFGKGGSYHRELEPPFSTAMGL